MAFKMFYFNLFGFYERNFIKLVLYIEDIKKRGKVMCLEKLYKGELFHQTLSPGFHSEVISVSKAIHID